MDKQLPSCGCPRARSIRGLVAVVFALAAAPIHADSSPYTAAVHPSTTYGLIADLGPDDFHFAYEPGVAPDLRRGQLVVLMPGTGSKTSEYSSFLSNAAALGFHGVALSYPNQGDSVGIACNAPPFVDPDCHRKARLEITTGADVSPLFQVDLHNSIESRLLWLLAWLSLNYPDDGWDQYWTPFGPVWQEIIVCGHSQGGGHALFLSQRHSVARAISFSSIDWYLGENKPARWLREPFATSIDRIFMFNHLHDEGIDFEGMTRMVADTLGVTRYGDPSQVENDSTGEFSGAHFLVTNLSPVRAGGEGGLKHNTTILDADLQIDDGGSPLARSAWDHLLTHETPPVRLEPRGAELRVYFSPGTLCFSTDNDNWVQFPSPYTQSPLVISATNPTWPKRGFFSLIPEGPAP